MGGEWSNASLGELLKFSNGKTSPERSDSSSIPVYGSNGIIGYANEHNSPQNSIIIGRVGSYCGSVYHSPTECWVTDNAIKATAINSNSSKFLFYLLGHLELNQWREGSGQPLLNQSILKNIDAAIPCIDEQKTIAHILGTLDDKIELNRRMNATLEAMARALFKSWFVDFDPVIDNALAAGNPIPEPLQTRAKARKALGDQRKPLPAAIQKQFPNRFLFTEETGWVPEGWKVSTVGEEFNVTMGQSPPGNTYNESGEGVPFFQGRADFGFRYPSNRVYCTAPKRLASKGDTLVSVRAPVGDVNMAAADCCIGRGVSASRHKSGSRSFTFYAMLQLREYFKVFEGEGTVFGSINQKDFKALPMLGIPAELVEEFEVLAGGFDEKIEIGTEFVNNLINIRDTLLPKLISGQLRVPDAEELVAEVV